MLKRPRHFDLFRLLGYEPASPVGVPHVSQS